MKLYNKLAKYYDAVFNHDYEKEVKTCDKLISKKGTLLDIGCGTGGHMKAFQKIGYSVEGLDKSKEMIEQAKNKMPNTVFHKGRMQWLNLSKKYDAITLLNRTILFVKSKRQLKGTLKRIHKHLVNDGILLMDLDTHEDYFDQDKNQTHYFNNQKGVEGSITEEYDQRGNKILWSANFSINDKGQITRVVDNQEYLMRELGFKVSVHDMKGKETNNYEQPLLIVGKVFKDS